MLLPCWLQLRWLSRGDSESEEEDNQQKPTETAPQDIRNKDRDKRGDLGCQSAILRSRGCQVQLLTLAAAVILSASIPNTPHMGKLSLLSQRDVGAKLLGDIEASCTMRSPPCTSRKLRRWRSSISCCCCCCSSSNCC